METTMSDTPRIPMKDAIFLTIQGRLLAESTLAEVWLDASGHHVRGDSILAADTEPEFDFESAMRNGDSLRVSVMRGSTGHVLTFDGKVSRTGMRTEVAACLVNTFQIDESVPL